MTTHHPRARSCALALAAVAAVGACSGGQPSATGTPSATTTSATTTSATTTSGTPSTSTSTTSTSTVPPTSATTTPPAAGGVPAGAGTATTVDLDGDGRPDTVWLADVDGARTLGVTTTAHGTSSVVFTSAAPQAASASAAVLASGAPVVLLDTGRSVQVHGYRAGGGGLVAVPDPQGRQYSFSLGFTGEGTGLTCLRESGGLHLFGENATPDAAGTTWTVTRTEVDVDLDRPRAVNGATTTVARGVPGDDPAVQAARGTTCGADAAVATEPQ